MAYLGILPLLLKSTYLENIRAKYRNYFFKLERLFIKAKDKKLSIK